MKYKDIIDRYINSANTSKDFHKFLNKLFFIYPSLKITDNKITDITHDISENLNIPFHDIRVIGSTHLGFSFIKPKDSNEVKLFDDDSDIDIAIINKELFYSMYCNTFDVTKGFIDNSKFKEAKHYNMFRNNLFKGYIRPDTIADTKFRTDWLRYFKELSILHHKNISAAVYLNEMTFHRKLEDAFKIYERKVSDNGVK